MRVSFSGRMAASQAADPGSIPGTRTKIRRKRGAFTDYIFVAGTGNRKPEPGTPCTHGVGEAGSRVLSRF